VCREGGEGRVDDFRGGWVFFLHFFLCRVLFLDTRQTSLFAECFFMTFGKPLFAECFCLTLGKPPIFYFLFIFLFSWEGKNSKLKKFELNLMYRKSFKVKQ